MTTDHHAHDILAGFTAFTTTMLDGWLSRGEQVLFAIIVAVVSSTVSRIVWEMWEKRKK